MPMITVNMDKARAIAHTHRREARAQEFAPYDKIVALQVPGQNAADAETARAAIRAKYSTIQANIDAATTVEGLQTILAALPS